MQAAQLGILIIRDGCKEVQVGYNPVLVTICCKVHGNLRRTDQGVGTFQFSYVFADILERVLDKGIVIAGDIKIQIADIDLITIKIRLLVASVDKAMEMGINWWQEDTYLSTKAREKELMQQQETLEARLEKLEALNKPL